MKSGTKETNEGSVSEQIDEKALKALIRAAVALNQSKTKAKR
ncbi:hypothetical protein [Lysobacter sp. S4-A87]|nr:hypothetical protein [Lysobacter sp. S4-A87]